MTEKLLAEIDSGQKAQDDYAIVQPRLDKMRQNIVHMWETSSAMETEVRETLFHKLHAINELKRSFVNDIETGKLASKQLEAENAKHRR